MFLSVKFTLSHDRVKRAGVNIVRGQLNITFLPYFS